jgi:hypothetical protein
VPERKLALSEGIKQFDKFLWEVHFIVKQGDVAE